MTASVVSMTSDGDLLALTPVRRDRQSLTSAYNDKLAWPANARQESPRITLPADRVSYIHPDLIVGRTFAQSFGNRTISGQAYHVAARLRLAMRLSRQMKM